VERSSRLIVVTTEMVTIEVSVVTVQMTDSLEEDVWAGPEGVVVMREPSSVAVA